jgi:hypothetical protein
MHLNVFELNPAPPGGGDPAALKALLPTGGGATMKFGI